jgi:hypothetical protein
MSGCTSLQLYYTKPPIETAGKGAVSLIVHDQRPPDEGGKEPMKVGVVRNAFGMPFAMKATNTEPSRILKELTSDCLKAAGYKPVDQSDTIPQLHIYLKSFWSDGYQMSRTSMDVMLELKKTVTSPALWSHSLLSDSVVMWTAGTSPMEKGFHQVLEDAKQKMIAQFKDPKFAAAYKSLCPGVK